MKSRVFVEGIVKSRSGGFCFKIRAGCDEDVNRVKDFVVNSLILNGVVCTVEQGFYDNDKEVELFVSE